MKNSRIETKLIGIWHTTIILAATITPDTELSKSSTSNTREFTVFVVRLDD